MALPVEKISPDRVSAPRFLTAREVSDLLSVSPKRVYELAQRREIPSVRVGQRQLRFIESEILTWARNGGTPLHDLPHAFNVMKEQTGNHKNIGATAKGVAR